MPKYDGGRGRGREILVDDVWDDFVYDQNRTRERHIRVQVRYKVKESIGGTYCQEKLTVNRVDRLHRNDNLITKDTVKVQSSPSDLYRTIVRLRTNSRFPGKEL